MPRRAGSGQLPLPRGWEEVGDYDARSSTSTTTPGGPAGSTPGTGGLPGRGWARGPASEARRRLLSGRPGREAAPEARGAGRGPGKEARDRLPEPGLRKPARRPGGGRLQPPLPGPSWPPACDGPGTFRHSGRRGKGGIDALGGHSVQFTDPAGPPEPCSELASA